MKRTRLINKILIGVVTLTILVGPAIVWGYYEDPHQQFDMTRNKTNEFKVIFVQAADVTQACELESKRRGFGGFGIAVDSCAFYNGSMTECTIITPRSANFHTIGHEVRHCLQGHWHK